MSNMPAKLPNLMAFDEQHDSDSTYGIRKGKNSISYKTIKCTSMLALRNVKNLDLARAIITPANKNVARK